MSSRATARRQVVQEGAEEVLEAEVVEADSREEVHRETRCQAESGKTMASKTSREAANLLPEEATGS